MFCVNQLRLACGSVLYSDEHVKSFAVDHRPRVINLSRLADAEKLWRTAFVCQLSKFNVSTWALF